MFAGGGENFIRSTATELSDMECVLCMFSNIKSDAPYEAAILVLLMFLSMVFHGYNHFISLSSTKSQ